MRDVQLWLLSAMRHNLGKYREDHYILLTHYRAYPIQGFLVSLCCRLRGLQFFSYQKIILLYVMMFGLNLRSGLM